MHESAQAQLQLLRLASPALPVGAYAHSQGLEFAADAGWVCDAAGVRAWVLGLLTHSVAALDIPVLRRMMESASDDRDALWWSRFLLASRGSAELRNEDNRTGGALLKLLRDLDAKVTPCKTQDATYALGFAAAATHFGIDIAAAARGYCWAFAENQVAAALRLLPLGQTAGQKILGACIAAIPQCVERGLALSDNDIGGACPGLGIASALHETQYSRLFRS